MEIKYDLEEIEDVAKEIICHSKSKTLLFYGDMGVGKTTLIKTLVRVLGSEEITSSPTFSIVNEYLLDNDGIYHFDLYRVKDVEELYNFGIEDYLETDYWKFIEWPEKIEPILYGSYNKIILRTEDNKKRTLNLE